MTAETKHPLLDGQFRRISLTETQNDYFTREAFKSLRTNLFFCGTDVGAIALTSCDANEGKTTVSLELARSLAEAGKTVLLIDADMRKSVMVSRYTDGAGEDGLVDGLSQYLSSQKELQDVLYATSQDNLFVIFSGPYPANPVELLSNRRFAELIESARQSFDYVIVDTPPLGYVIDGAVIAGVIGNAIIVVSTNHVHNREAKRVKSQLELSGCRILGVILNHGRDSKRKYRDRYSEYHRSYYASDPSKAPDEGKKSKKKK